MKRLFWVIYTVISVSFAVSCDQLPGLGGDDLKPGTKLIKVDPVVSDYQSKAASTAFENGDRIGVYVFTDETWLDNAEYVAGADGFSAKTENYWYEDEQLSSALFSYYPYSSSNNGVTASISFSVKNDQSSKEGFSSSDFMCAFAEASPSDEPVRLPFKHALSKIILKFENNLGENISSVVLDGVYTSVKVGVTLAGSVEHTGSKGSVSLSKVQISGQEAWAAVLVPEKGTAPSFQVTLESGKVMDYVVENQFDLESGCSHTASVTLNKPDGPDVPEPEDPVSVVFDVIVSDWNKGDEMVFVKDEDQVVADEWTYLGVGSFVDDILAIGGRGNYEMFVKMYEKTDSPGIYKLENPYKEWPHWAVSQEKDVEYLDGCSIIVNASDPSKIYIEDADIASYSGVTLKAGSYCVENGFENSQYGFFYGDGTNVYIYFPNNSIYLNVDGEKMQTNLHGRTIITLPGYDRPALYGYQYLHYSGEYIYDGVSYAGFETYSELDNPHTRFAILEGRVEYIGILMNELIDGTIPSQLLYDSSMIGTSLRWLVPISESGTYTAVVYTVLPDGNYYYHYRYFYHQMTGDPLPECDFKLNYMKADDKYPEGTIEFNFSCPDYDRIHFALYDSELLEGKPDEELELMVMNDKYENIYYRGLESSEGMSIYVPNLEPDTEYTLLALCYNNAGNSTFAKATARTASEPTYKYLGMGRYYDNFWLLGDGYSTDVEIYVAENDPEKFRVMNPYRNYWKNPIEGLDGAEPEIKHFDIYTEYYNGVDYVYYSHIHTGAIMYLDEVQVSGEIVYDQWYWTTRRESMYSTYHCYMIDDGVLQIAPSARISGTTWHYDWRSADEAVVLALPGAEYVPSYNVTKVRRSSGVEMTQLKRMESIPVITELGKYPSYKYVDIKEIKYMEKQ